MIKLTKKEMNKLLVLLEDEVDELNTLYDTPMMTRITIYKSIIEKLENELEEN